MSIRAQLACVRARVRARARPLTPRPLTHHVPSLLQPARSPHGGGLLTPRALARSRVRTAAQAVRPVKVRPRSARLRPGPNRPERIGQDRPGPTGPSRPGPARHEWQGPDLFDLPRRAGLIS